MPLTNPVAAIQALDPVHIAAVFDGSSPLVPWLDLAGTAVFAVSGALAAAQMNKTLVTFMFFAAVTGVGGGTVRDVLIGAPVFWMHQSTPIVTCLAMALVVWFTPQRIWPRQALEWFDGVGLAAYSVFGAGKALAFGIPPVPAAIMGVVTASMGGIFRDMLAGVPSIVLRPEIYVTACRWRRRWGWALSPGLRCADWRSGWNWACHPIVDDFAKTDWACTSQMFKPLSVRAWFASKRCRVVAYLGRHRR